MNVPIQWNMPKDERTQAQIEEDHEKNYQRLLAQWPQKLAENKACRCGKTPQSHPEHFYPKRRLDYIKEAAQRLADQIDKFALEQSDTLPNPEFVLDKSRKDT